LFKVEHDANCTLPSSAKVKNSRFEVYITLKVQVEVFSVVTLCSFAVRYQCFGESCCLHLQGEVNGAGKEGTDIGKEYKR
jgi:hypothetical protein